MSETTARRPFRIAAALALLVTASISIGCGGGSTSPTTPPMAAPRPSPLPFVLPAGAVAGSVSGNHDDGPHRAVITVAQLVAGGALTLNIQGESVHAHEVSFTGAEVTQIANGVPVSRVSSTNPHDQGHGNHNHTIAFN